MASAGDGLAALQAQVQAVMEKHHPEVARWDRDLTAEGGDGAEGVLPTLRAAEDTLLRAEGKCARVDRLLQLQEVCVCG